MSSFSKGLTTYLFLAFVSQFGHCQDANDSLKQVAFIESMGDTPTEEQMNTLIDLTGDRTEISSSLPLPGPAITVAEMAGDKLAALRPSNAIYSAAITKIESGVSPAQFAVLLNAFNYDCISDTISVRLQKFASLEGESYVQALLEGLASAPGGVGDSFDLIIFEALNSDSVDVVAAATMAIVNRRSRVLSWNSRLVELCREPTSVRVHVAPDVIVATDLRVFAFRALRANGFPSPLVADFLRNFTPPFESELFWQVRAARFALLNDDDAIAELIAGLSKPDSRRMIAEVLSENVKVSEKFKRAIYESAVAHADLSSIRLGKVFITQYSPEGLSSVELQRLRRVLGESYFDRFDEWVRLPPSNE